MSKKLMSSYVKAIATKQQLFRTDHSITCLGYTRNSWQCFIIIYSLFKGNVFPIDVKADDFITGLDQNTNTEGTSTGNYSNKRRERPDLVNQNTNTEGGDYFNPFIQLGYESLRFFVPPSD
jgi:hypothetical protein